MAYVILTSTTKACCKATLYCNGTGKLKHYCGATSKTSELEAARAAVRKF